MPGHDYRKDFFSRPHLWLIALAGVIVPRRLRADWRQEWEAELRCRETLLAEWEKLDWRNKLDLLRRSVGAFLDALCLQPRRLEDEMFQDLRFGARLLAKKPGFTLLAVATLALGIGVNTAIFTGFNLLIRPRPVKDPDTVVKLDNLGVARGLFSYSEYVAFRDHAQTISEWLPSFGERFLLGETTAGVEPEEIGGSFVSENYLSELGGGVQIGRFFTAEENRVAGRDAVVVLSHQFWQRRFAGNPQIVGRPLSIDGKPFIVIGVTNPAFVGLSRAAPDIWLPLMMRAAMPSVHTEDFAGANPDWFGAQDYQWLSLHARLKPGRTIVEAQAEISLLFSQLPRPTDQTTPRGAVTVTPFSGQELRRAAFRNTMALTLGASGLVLLIACSNLANMLLARAAGRQKEIGVRLALGASRLRVMRQLLTESFLLAVLGGAAGALLAWWSCEMFLPLLFARWVGEDFARMALSLTPDWRVLSFALLLSSLSGLAFGLIPALRATKPNLIAVIKEDSAAFGGRLARSWLRNGLVVSQVALCLALLIPAGLLIRGLAKALSADPGFETNTLLIVFYSLELSGYDEGRLQLFHQQLQERLQGLPGVTKVSPNFGSGGRVTMVLPAEQGVSEKRFEPAPFRWVSSDYFATVGTPLMQGRDFTAEEARTRAPVVIISESTANRIWLNENPIGKTIRAERRLRNGAIQIDLPAAQVIGVAGDAQTWRVGEIPPLFFYAPAVERKWGVEGSFLVRSIRDAASLKGLALKEALALEPVLRFDSFTMEESIARDGNVTAARNVSELVTALGSLALVLAALGIYGTLAFTVAQRTREIGIRMALGAQARNVQMLIVRQAMTLALIGVLAGLPISIAATRVLQSMLLGSSGADPVAYGGVVSLLLSAALLACFVPARRASRVDPIIALRHE